MKATASFITAKRTIAVLALAASFVSPHNALSQKKSPQIQLAHSENGTVLNLARLLADPSLSCTIPGYEVQHFSLLVRVEGQDELGPFYTNGAEIPGKQLALIKGLRERNSKKIRLLFESIYAKDNDKMTRAFNNLTYVIE
jgi:hypothetical protein